MCFENANFRANTKKKKLTGHIGFRLSVRASVCAYIRQQLCMPGF